MFQTFGLHHVLFLVEAMRLTLLLFAVGLVGGSLVGAVLALLAALPAKLPNRIARTVIYVVQGIPLIVLLGPAHQQDHVAQQQ